MNNLMWTLNHDTQKYEYLSDSNRTEMMRELKTLDEKIQSCTIPDSILHHISTDNLLELVLDYPLNINLFFYDTIIAGFTAISEYHPALREFLTRDNQFKVLQTYRKENPSFEQQQPDNPALIKKVMLQCLEAFREGDSHTQLQNPPIVQVDTPNGSVVDVFDNSNETDLTDAVKAYLSNRVHKCYPTVDIISNPTQKYNCHSYAWHNQSVNNQYWMNDPSAYMADGSYRLAGNHATAYLQKAYYPDQGNEHSGIVSDPNEEIIISKWGIGPLVKHAWNICPYVHGAFNNLICYYG